MYQDAPPPCTCTARGSATQPICLRRARVASVSLARTSTKLVQLRQGQPRAGYLEVCVWGGGYTWGGSQ